MNTGDRIAEVLARLRNGDIGEPVPPPPDARWVRIEHVFAEALAAGADARAVIARECAGDPDLAREVESLLAAHGAPGAADRLEQELTSHTRDDGPAVGDRLGRYAILGRLGRGGMGLVYAARDERLGRTVALKLLPRILSVDPDATRRFLLEAQSAAALDHPNICAIHEVGESDDGRLFMAMPLYRGETVAARLARGPLPVPEALTVAAAVARGLEHAHAHGIVHRDIKPPNLFLVHDGTVKILDFGIAKMADVSLTASGAILGTIPYMSPEQAGGDPVDHRTDLWSLGVVLYEMITGQRPFDGANAQGTIAAILTDDPPPLPRAAGTGAMHQLLGRLLAKDPAERLPSASVTAAAVEDALHALEHGPVWEGAEHAPPIAPEGERRQVAVLVTQIGAYTDLVERLAPDALERTLQRIRATASDIASRQGGVLHQFTGESLVCLFGVPATHEDDVERAVRAARALRAWGADPWTDTDDRAPPLALRSGVCAGTVIVQPDPASRTHRVAGDPLERASSLARHAGRDEVLVGPECQRLVSASFETRPGTPMVLPDGRGTATPHAVTGETAGPRATSGRMLLTPFAGRAREMTTLAEALALARTGDGQLVTIEGEAGTGKSRLLLELQESEADGFEVVHVCCRPHELGAPPYHPFVSVVRELLDLGSDAAQALEPDHVEREVAARAPELAPSLPVLCHLIGIPAERHPLPRHLEGESLREAIRDALATLVTLASRTRPVALLLEDWHWADEASQEVLRQVIELLPTYPLAVLVSYRPGHGLEWPDGAPRKPIRLGPLDPGATTQLIRAMLGAERVRAETAATIHERAGGNPFFAEELCHALQEQGALTVRDGEAALSGQPETLHLPGTIQGVIRTRLDRLDPGAREIARAASVAGREFSLALLQHLVTADTPLAQALDRLKRASVIQQTRLVPDPAYRFKHVLTQEVIYDTLLAHRRRALHAQVGTALQTLHPDRVAEMADELSYHFSRAESWPEAVRYGREEARQAQAFSEYPRALSVLDRVEEWAKLLRTGPERREALVAVLLDQERLCETLGLRKRQEEILDRLLELADPEHDRATLARVYHRQGDLSLLLRRFESAREALERALMLSRETGSVEIERDTLTSLGLLCWHADRGEEGLPFVQQALAIDRGRGATEEIARDLFNLSTLLKSLRQWDAALTALDEARQLADQAGNPVIQSIVLFNIGNVHRMRGDTDRALTYMRQAVAVNVSHASAEGRAGMMGSLAALLVDVGEVEEALNSYREAVTLGRKSRSAESLAHLLPNLAQLLVGIGRGSEALPYLYEAVEVFGQVEDREAERETWGRIGRLEEEQRDHGRAAQAWGRARVLRREAGDAEGELEAAVHLARALRETGNDPTAARAAFGEAVTLAAQLEDRATEGDLCNGAGILEWRVGNYEAALDHYERASVVFRALRDRPREGLALNSIGATLLCLRRLDDAVARLTDAVALNHATGQELLEGHALASLGDAHFAKGNPADAARCYETSLAIRRRIGDRRGEGWMLHNLARAAAGGGDRARATALARDAGRIAVAIGDHELAHACDATLEDGAGAPAEHPQSEGNDDA